MTNEEKILDLLAVVNNRIGNIETNVAGLQADVAGIRMDMENRIDPQLQALAEGQKTILETLSPKSRVEALEEEVDFMKRVMKSLAREIDELKKAN